MATDSSAGTPTPSAGDPTVSSSIQIEPATPSGDGSRINLDGASLWIPTGWTSRPVGDDATVRMAFGPPDQASAIVEVQIGPRAAISGAVSLSSVGAHSQFLISGAFATVTRMPGIFSGWDHVEIVEGVLAADAGRIRLVTVQAGAGPVVTVTARLPAESSAGSLPDLVQRSIRPEPDRA